MTIFEKIKMFVNLLFGIMEILLQLAHLTSDLFFHMLLRLQSASELHILVSLRSKEIKYLLYFLTFNLSLSQT